METKIYQKNRGLLKYPSVKQENGGIFLNVRTIMKSLRAWLESYFQCLKGLLCEPGSLFSSSTSPISEKLIEYDFFLSALKLCSYSAGMSSPVIPGELIKAWWLLGICLQRNEMTIFTLYLKSFWVAYLTYHSRGFDPHVWDRRWEGMPNHRGGKSHHSFHILLLRSIFFVPDQTNQKISLVNLLRLSQKA